MMDVIEHVSDFCGRESDQAFYWEKTEHKGGACYLENKSVIHKSPVIVATISLQIPGGTQNTSPLADLL